MLWVPRFVSYVAKCDGIDIDNLLSSFQLNEKIFYLLELLPDWSSIKRNIETWTFTYLCKNRLFLIAWIMFTSQLYY